ncbi:BTAD domain-containing putative transcriptional regulator [Streptosporangium sp. CA-115845]|uniref:AfsR/SARP family transcriptional regulator n=1 Tax=Streptosporangium sp. CA-115845 TaxID=3240071 RepID=UPI003D8EA34E
MDEPLEFRIMGPLGVFRKGEELRIGGPRERAILASLVLNAGRVVGVDRLIEAVWGGHAPQSARGQIAICVSRLRRALGDRADDIMTSSPGYLLRAAPEQIDRLRFDDLVARARRQAAGGDREGAIAMLRDALSLWRGTPFEDIHSMRYDAARLRESRLEAIEACLELELELGNHLKVIAELVPVVEEHPLRERARAQLMVAQYRSGRRAESLRTYQEGRRHLVEQVGLEPGPELRRLHDQILRDESALMEVSGVRRAEEFVIPSQLPPQALPFTGRAAELAVLDDALRFSPEATGPGTVVVTGLGGFGKTALALRWAHRGIAQFPDGQLFADLQGDEGATALAPGVVADRFLRALGVAGHLIPEDLSEKLALYRSRTARRRLLVVLDNARDSAQVIPLLPGGAHCRVIVTSRDPLDEFVARQGAHREFVRPLGFEESRALAVMLVGAARMEAEPQAMARLAASSSGCPLTLRMAAARLCSGSYRGSVGELAGYDGYDLARMVPRASVSAFADASAPGERQPT